MTAPQENRSPPDCREPCCGHLVEIVMTLGGKSQAADRCALHKPMWPKCPWHTKNNERTEK